MVATVYPAYQKQLAASNAADFDDLLLHVATLLRDNPEVRASLDQRYRFILVDEYQDTNLAQYAIARAMSIDYPNLAVTGDPDQSIYGWRGANLNNILDFERDYPEVHVVRLERNYRSTQRILRVAADLIAHNVRRKEKGLFTENGPGAPVRLVTYATQKDEADGIAARIAGRDPQWPPPSPRFRHLLSRQRPEPGLRVRPARVGRTLPDGQRAGVLPTQRDQGHPGLPAPAEQSAGRGGPAAGHQRAGPGHRQNHDRPTFGLRDATWADAVGRGPARPQPRSVDGRRPRPGQVGSSSSCVDRLTAAVDGPVEEILGLVLSETGYRRQFAHSEDEEDQERLANIEELLTVARDFDERRRRGGPTGGFLEETCLVNERTPGKPMPTG